MGLSTRVGSTGWVIFAIHKLKGGLLAAPFLLLGCGFGLGYSIQIG
jgi:hypothetical protein